MNPKPVGTGPEIRRRGAENDNGACWLERGVGRVVTERDVGPVYEGSDGHFYTAWQVDRKLTSGDWRPCLQYPDAGRRLVASEDGDLLMLVRVDPATLPDWAELRADGEAVRVVDTRRTTP